MTLRNPQNQDASVLSPISESFKYQISLLSSLKSRGWVGAAGPVLRKLDAGVGGAAELLQRRQPGRGGVQTAWDTEPCAGRGAELMVCGEVQKQGLYEWADRTGRLLGERESVLRGPVSGPKND